MDFRIPIEVGRARIQPRDLIFGDRDGVLVIPEQTVEDAISLALEKARTEDTVRIAIENGMSAEEAFDTFGVL